MSEKQMADVAAQVGRMVGEAYRAYGEWLCRWRQAHPEDDRDDYELTDVYYREGRDDGDQ